MPDTHTHTQTDRQTDTQTNCSENITPPRFRGGVTKTHKEDTKLDMLKNQNAYLPLYVVVAILYPPARLHTSVK